MSKDDLALIINNSALNLVAYALIGEDIKATKIHDALMTALSADMNGRMVLADMIEMCQAAMKAKGLFDKKAS